MKTRLHPAAARRRIFACRFPGCEYTAHRPQDRGRHESLIHGMRKGLLPAAEPLSGNGTNPTEKQSPLEKQMEAFKKLAPKPEPAINIRLALESAIENLERQKRVLAEALEKL